jgi:hypothetical protein
MPAVAIGGRYPRAVVSGQDAWHFSGGNGLFDANASQLHICSISPPSVRGQHAVSSVRLELFGRRHGYAEGSSINRIGEPHADLGRMIQPRRGTQVQS